MCIRDRILDLATDLIRLGGHSPDSIEIVETGMRPGEKLYEELYYGEEKSIPTSHEQILSSQSRTFPFEEVEHQVQTLIDAAYAGTDVIKKLIKKFVPEYDNGEKPMKIAPKMSLGATPTHSENVNESL